MNEFQFQSSAAQPQATTTQEGRRDISYGRVTLLLFATLILVGAVLFTSERSYYGTRAYYDAMVAELTLSIEQSPRNVELYELLGELHFEWGEYSLARASYQHYLQLAGDEAVPEVVARLAELDTAVAYRS